MVLLALSHTSAVTGSVSPGILCSTCRRRKGGSATRVQPRKLTELHQDVVDNLVSQSSDQSCAYLLRALDTKSADELMPIFGVPVTFHTTVSASTLQGLIRDSISPKAGPENLHFAIAHSSRNPSCETPLPGGMSADIDHHFLVVWMTHLGGMQFV